MSSLGGLVGRVVTARTMGRMQLLSEVCEDLAGRQEANIY